MAPDYARYSPRQDDPWHMGSSGRGNQIRVPFYSNDAQERHTGLSPSTDTPDWAAERFQWTVNTLGMGTEEGFCQPTQSPYVGDPFFRPSFNPTGNLNVWEPQHSAQGSSSYPAVCLNLPQASDFSATFAGFSQRAATASGVPPSFDVHAENYGQSLYPSQLNAHHEGMGLPDLRQEILPNPGTHSPPYENHGAYDVGSIMLMAQHPLQYFAIKDLCYALDHQTSNGQVLLHTSTLLPKGVPDTQHGSVATASAGQLERNTGQICSDYIRNTIPPQNAHYQTFRPDESGRHEAPEAAYALSKELITQAADPPTNLGIQQDVGVGIFPPSPLQNPASLVATFYPLGRCNSWQNAACPLCGSSNIGCSTSHNPVQRFEESKSDCYLDVPSRRGSRSRFPVDVGFGADLGDRKIWTTPISRTRNRSSRINLSASPSRSSADSQAHTPMSSGSSIGMPSRQQSPSEQGEHINVVDLLYTFVDRDTAWTADDIPRLIGLCQSELLKRGRDNFSDLFSKDIKPEVGTNRSRADRKTRQKNGTRYFCHLDGCLSSFTRKYGFSNHLGAHIGLTDRVCSTCGRYYCASSITRHEVTCARNHTSNQHLLAAGVAS